MVDDPLQFGFWKEWRSYRDEQNNLEVRQAKEVKIVTDPEVTPGYLFYWVIQLDSRDARILFQTERNMKWERSIDDLVDFGHQNFKLQAEPFLSRFDEQNNVYVVSFDPPRPLPYDKEFVLDVVNLNKNNSINIVKAFVRRAVRKIDVHITDPLTALQPEVSPIEGLIPEEDE